MTDPVKHPAHYTAYKGLEIIDLTKHLSYCDGNAVKYIARAGLKDPETEVQDLEKALQYIEWVCEDPSLVVEYVGHPIVRNTVSILVPQLMWMRARVVMSIVEGNHYSAGDLLRIEIKHFKEFRTKEKKND